MFTCPFLRECQQNINMHVKKVILHCWLISVVQQPLKMHKAYTNVNGVSHIHGFLKVLCAVFLLFNIQTENALVKAHPHVYTMLENINRLFLDRTLKGRTHSRCRHLETYINKIPLKKKMNKNSLLRKNQNCNAVRALGMHQYRYRYQVSALIPHFLKYS